MTKSSAITYLSLSSLVHIVCGFIIGVEQNQDSALAWVAAFSAAATLVFAILRIGGERGR